MFCHKISSIQSFPKCQNCFVMRMAECNKYVDTFQYSLQRIYFLFMSFVFLCLFKDKLVFSTYKLRTDERFADFFVKYANISR